MAVAAADAGVVIDERHPEAARLDNICRRNGHEASSFLVDAGGAPDRSPDGLRRRHRQPRNIDYTAADAVAFRRPDFATYTAANG